MLHSEEIEIIVPQINEEDNDNPLILSIGPALGMMVPVILMAFLGKRIYATSSSSIISSSLIMGGGSCLVTLIFATSTYLYRKNKKEKNRSKKRKEFDDYIKGLTMLLDTYKADNREYMYERYPDTVHIIKDRLTKKRFYLDQDYLFCRIGTGKIPFQVKLKKTDGRKEMVKSYESSTADDVIERYRYLDDVPVGINLSDGNYFAFVSSKDNSLSYEYMLCILFNLAISNDCKNFHMVLLFDEDNPDSLKIYESIKFLPHLSMGEGNRMCAGNRQECISLCSYLNNPISVKEDEVYVIADVSFGKYKGNLFYLDAELPNFKTIELFENISEIPSKYRTAVELPIEGTNICNVYKNGDYASTRNHFRIDECPLSVDYQISDYIRSNLTVEQMKSAMVTEIPDNVDFLKLFNATQIEDIDICGMWNDNRFVRSLAVPIGISNSNEKIYLDVHEKCHGPHGLIAGTTGSGKSELIQTYLISLALSYSPEDVTFFLIDYKGGGTGVGIDELPHCAGVVSNLSGNDIKRAMDAVRSENIKRQKLFAKYGVNHIDTYRNDYRMGRIPTNIPHLILIIDEFAELKKEEPEFMQEIISLSAVGRSLGIHLILATQKPSGVVDDKIWSNSRFRLCLKVQDKSDSMDMLKRPEGAYIQKPGRCYIQIGNNEYFKCFQTGYCKTAYKESGKMKNSVNLLTRRGEKIRYENENEDAHEGTLLDKLTLRIINEAEKRNIKNADPLWMNELPNIIKYPSTKDSVPEGKDMNDTFLLGWYDDTINRIQDVFSYNLIRDGHLAIMGGPYTGKSTILKSIIIQSKECEIALADVSGGEITKAGKLNNCIGYASDDKDIPVFMYHLKKRMAHKGRKLLVIIDNFALFLGCLSDEDVIEFNRMILEGIRNNVFFIMSASMSSDFPGKLFGKIKTTLCLEMNDRFHYCDAMRLMRIETVPKGSTPGRCIYAVNERILECQAYDCTELFEDITGKISDDFIECTTRFPHIPKECTLDRMLMQYNDLSGSKGKLCPIGYSLKTGYIRGVDISLRGSFVITGTGNCGKHVLLENIKVIIAQCLDEYRQKTVLIEDAKDLTKELYDTLGDKFIIMLFDPLKDQELLYKPHFRAIADYNQGILLGANASGSKILTFDDLSYSSLTAHLLPDTGYLRIHGNDKTIKVKLPSNQRKEICDDYD